MRPAGAAATLDGGVTGASWTYELPPTGSAAENLDDYEACAADGEHLGIVAGLVRRDGELYVLVDAGRLPPFVHRRVAVRLEDVLEIDHDALVVTVAGSRAWLESSAVALDPSGARHGPGAEASRVHELPTDLAAPVAAGSAGPVERAASLAVIAAAVLTAYSLFAAVAIWAARGLSGWEYAVLVPPLAFALLAVAAVGYRLYREPHAGRHPSPAR